MSHREKKVHKAMMITIVALLSTAAFGQDVESGARKVVIENDGRTVTFTDDVPQERTGYDSPWHYSHAIRAGDFVYISGVIIGANGNDSLPISTDRFREHTERVFALIQSYLSTADASLASIVKINTFHVLDGRNTSLTIDEQALIIAETNAKYAVEPHPAWTAVGTSGLFSPRGIVEIEMVAYAPLGGEKEE